MPPSRHRPVHFYVGGGCYFITAAIIDHQPLLCTPQRLAWFADRLAGAVVAEISELVAWVILPDHYHAIIRVPQERSIARLLHRLHGEAAHQLNLEDGTPGRQVWYSYWDHCLWTEGDLWSRINYIHRNPVKHGHVATPAQWAHSSWQQFASLAPASEAAVGLQRFPAPRQLPQDP
jgi:REP-associated tyrosine transposase